MVVRQLRVGRRGGAVAVETAMVMLCMTMLVFGVFEYSRLLMDWACSTTPRGKAAVTPW